MIAEPEAEAPSVSEVAAGEMRTLLLHSSHYLGGLVGNLAIGLVSFPIFTRVFPVAEYGLLDLAQRVLLMLTITAKLGMQNAVLRFYDKKQFDSDPQPARRYFSTMYLGTLLISAAVVALVCAGFGIAPGDWTSGPLAKLIWLISGLVLLRSLGAILWGFLRIEERTKMFNGTQVGTRAATVLLICALLPRLGRNAQTYFSGMVLVEFLLVGALTLWLVRRSLIAPSSFDSTLFRASIAFGTPLVVYEFAFAVLGSADRFLVRSYLGGDALGFYSVAYGLAQHANDLLVTPLTLAILPIYMRIWTTSGVAKTVEFLTLALDLFLMVSIGILAITVSSAHYLVVLLASSKYAGVDRLIPLLLFGLFIYATYIFVAAGLLIEKRTTQMAVYLVVAAGINIGLNCLLLPALGLIGSALAAVVSYGVSIWLLGRASSRFLPLGLKLPALARYLALGAVAALAASQLQLASTLAGLLARSAVSFSIYAAGLYAFDSRVRGATRSALAACRSRL